MIQYQINREIGMQSYHCFGRGTRLPFVWRLLCRFQLSRLSRHRLSSSSTLQRSTLGSCNRTGGGSETIIARVYSVEGATGDRATACSVSSCSMGTVGFFALCQAMWRWGCKSKSGQELQVNCLSLLLYSRRGIVLFLYRVASPVAKPLVPGNGACGVVLV